MISSVMQAVGLFLVTNVDDIIVLSLFFARGAGQRDTTTKILAGQYIGFGGILFASLAVTFGAGLFLPDAAIPYFGLIPLLLGAYAAWQAWRDGDDDDLAPDKTLGVLTVAAITFANGPYSSRSAPAPASHTASSSWLWSLFLCWPPSSWPPARLSPSSLSVGSTSCSPSS